MKEQKSRLGKNPFEKDLDFFCKVASGVRNEKTEQNEEDITEVDKSVIKEVSTEVNTSLHKDVVTSSHTSDRRFMPLGRPRKNVDPRTKHTFSIRVDHLEMLRGYCYWEEIDQKDVFDQFFTEFFKDKKIKKRNRKK